MGHEPTDPDALCVEDAYLDGVDPLARESSLSGTSSELDLEAGLSVGEALDLAQRTRVEREAGRPEAVAGDGQGELRAAQHAIADHHLDSGVGGDVVDVEQELEPTSGLDECRLIDEVDGHDGICGLSGCRRVDRGEHRSEAGEGDRELAATSERHQRAVRSKNSTASPRRRRWNPSRS